MNDRVTVREGLSGVRGRPAKWTRWEHVETGAGRASARIIVYIPHTSITAHTT